MRRFHLPFRLSAGLAACLLLSNIAAAEPLPAPVAEIRALLASGDADRAIEAADRAVEGFAGNAHAWFWAGRAYGLKAMQANIFAKPKWAGRTRDAWERAVALDPRHVDAHLSLLDFYRMAPSIMGGGEDKANAQVATIARLDASLGKFAEATLAYADDEARGGALLREALALDANNRRARMFLAAVAMQREDWTAARAAWEPALDAGPLQAVARYQLGKVAALSGDGLDTGLAHLDAYIAGEPDPELSVPAAHWRRGQILEKLGRGEEAIAAYRLALADPDVRKLAEADLARLTGS